MSRFFIKEEQICGDLIRIEGADAHHIARVLRMKEGEELLLCDFFNTEYRTVIRTLSGDFVEAEIVEKRAGASETPFPVVLYMALPKGDKMEFIIQKMVELGVYEIIPVAMKRCVVKLDDKKAKTKIVRWQGIAEAAAKQSKRGIVPQIHSIMTYKDALAYAADMDCKLVPYEMEESLDGAGGMQGTRKMLEAIKPGEAVAVFIGPEGGFDDSEIQSAISHGMKPITLGKRILRTETAGMTVMAWIMYQLEE